MNGDPDVNSFEDGLRQSLRREPPPAGFTERVLARVRATRPPVPVLRFAWWKRLLVLFEGAKLRWAAAVTAACLVLVVGQAGYRRHQREKAEIAREQALTALRIASAKLNVALRQIRRVDRSLNTNPGGSKSGRRTEHL